MKKIEFKLAPNALFSTIEALQNDKNKGIQEISISRNGHDFTVIVIREEIQANTIGHEHDL